MEIREKRTMNSKHFTRDDGQIDGHFHVGHVHYNSKLDGTGIRSIDWTLSFDETKRGWYFNYHSFRPFLPEYADGWVEFRDLFDDKDQIIKYKAHASHVLGRLVMPEEIGLKDTSVNCVIYDDAFGEGKDYILYFTRSTLKKVVRIREAYKGTVEQRFVFDVDFPKENEQIKKIKRKRVDDGDEYELDTTRDKTFDTARITKIGNDKGDGKEWATYFRSFKCWDSGSVITKKTESINVEYSAANKTLTKILTAQFLSSSTGDVFTDTTTSYYAGAGDGSVSSGYGTAPAGWDTTHDKTGTTGNTVDTNNGLALSTTDAGYRIDRVFFPIDTSALTALASISAASFIVRVHDVYNNDNDGKDFLTVLQTTQANPNGILVVEDFDVCGTINTPTEGIDTGEREDLGATSGTDFTATFVLNATGISWIDKVNPLTTNDSTKGTRFGIREGHDVIDEVVSGYVYAQIRTSESASEDPYVSVTYTLVASTPSRRRMIHH